MARTLLASQTDDGEVEFTAANVAGHMLGGGGDTILLVDNASGGDVDVTVQTAAQVDGLAVADKVVTVTDGTIARIGPFEPDAYDRATGAADPGTVYVDFESVTDVAVAALGI
jgi:hypothetical protein